MGMAGQQLLVLQILLVNDGMREVLQIARAVLLAHFERVKYVNLRAGHVDFVRQGRYSMPVLTTLIFSGMLGFLAVEMTASAASVRR